MTLMLFGRMVPNLKFRLSIPCFVKLIQYVHPRINQRVRINSSFSHTCSVTSGVPQGSCLGPLLFNLFINDVIDHLNLTSKAKHFADDLKLYTDLSHCSPNNLQPQLDFIHNWSNIWQIKISYSKYTILTIGHIEDHNQYLIDNNLIFKITHVRDLGVTVDHALKFNLHINTIVHRVNQRSAHADIPLFSFS